MTGPHLLRIYVAECRKTLGRGSGWTALGVAAGVGLLSVLVLAAGRHLGSQAVVNGATLPEVIRFTGPTALSWALHARNFYVLPLVLLWATGASFAGEIADHTLREALVRPVPRAVVLAAKVLALATLSAASLIVTATVAGAAGAALFGLEGTWGTVLAGFAASWLTDLGLIGLGVLASLWFRSVAGAVVGVVLMLMADLAARLALKLVAALGFETAGTLVRWMPGEALAAWEGYADGWVGAAFVGLLVLLGGTLGLAFLRLRRLDLP
ncbi:MAG: ABC transporter permease [Deltaproteobacteria bacterium]|nr:ABC transporter permease [Deltaproteobacteria bacterium]